MTPIVLALALLSDPLYHGARADAPELAAQIDRAAAAHGIAPLLLAAVVLVESRGRARAVSPRRRCGGRDVGAGQVHTHATDRSRLRQLLTLSINLDESARILARSRTLCRTTRRRWAMCRSSPWGAYNGGSRAWPGAVARVHRRLLEVIRGSRPTT